MLGPVVTTNVAKEPTKPMRSDDEPPAIYRAISTIGLLVMTFIVGALIADSQVWPYEPILRRGFQALRMTVSDVVRIGVHEIGGIWQPARTEMTGVTVSEPGALDAYTFYTSGHGTDAYLIDNEGKVLHTWSAPFEEVFPDPEHVSNPVGDRTVYLRRAHMFPNGDVIGIYEGFGDTPWGLGMVKIDRDSKVLWRYADRAHHDLEVADDGTITTLTHRIRDLAEEPLPVDAQYDSWVVEDYVVQLTPDGKEIRRMSLLEAMANSEFKSILGHTKFDNEKWDVTHANDASVLTPEFAAHHDVFQPGMVMVSMRTLDLLMVVDLDANSVVWASRGVWVHQHDPDPLPNGWILVFDNFGNSGSHGLSRVIEAHPMTGAVRWTYQGTPGNWFESMTRSMQEVLPNGNVFIVESDAGRMLEIDRSGKAVWAFRNPKMRKENTQVAVIASANRFPRSYVQFLGR